MFVDSGLPSVASPRAVDWDSLSEPLQVMLAGAALRRALVTAAHHAESLASAMEQGVLEDCGGPDALRLFAAMMRVTGEDGLGGPCPRDIMA